MEKHLTIRYNCTKELPKMSIRQLTYVMKDHIRRVYKSKYIWKRICIFMGALFCLILIWMKSFSTMKNEQKIRIIEQSINSLVNQEPCVFPDIPMNSSEIMKFIEHLNYPECDEAGAGEWMSCEKSNCMIKQTVITEKGATSCNVRDIIRVNDYETMDGTAKIIKDRDKYVLMESDYAYAECKSEKGEGWKGILVGTRESVDPSVGDIPDQPYNILMFGFDSLSRNHFMRKLPNAYKYLTEELKSDVLQGYNIIGDGTPQALIPILTGYTELELPDTRKSSFFQSTNDVDVYPMIWKEYRKHGFVTSFNEDTPTYGIFTYRLSGFRKVPTDHYMRNLYLYSEKNWGQSKEHCIGNKDSHLVMMDYSKQILLNNPTRPSFTFSFHGALSHNSFNLIGAIDDDIVGWLKNLKSSNLLHNTILIMMSDHGNRFADVRNTLQGKQEERLPFFSFVFPESFKTKYNQEYLQFKDNIKRLTTPFDIHATFEHILELQTNGKFRRKPKHTREKSLLDSIPKERSCKDAYIETHWCACLNWQNIDKKSVYAIKTAEAVTQRINSLTEHERNICEVFRIENIEWAAKIQPHDSLLKFKQSSDNDGFMADLTADMKTNSVVYQVKVKLQPGGALFEATATYNFETHSYVVDESSISRINRYGSQANCIYKKNPELRKYCYCKNV